MNYTLISRASSYFKATLNSIWFKLGFVWVPFFVTHGAHRRGDGAAAPRQPFPGAASPASSSNPGRGNLPN